MKVTESGTQLDAEFTVERSDAQTTLTVESRGGARGAPNERNTQYDDALRVLLDRLGARQVRITDALVTSRTALLRYPAAEQRRLADGISYPIRVADHVPDELRRALGRAMRKVARDPSLTSTGNNNKRVTFWLDGPATTDPAELERYLATQGGTVVEDPLAKVIREWNDEEGDLEKEARAADEALADYGPALTEEGLQSPDWAVIREALGDTRRGNLGPGKTKPMYFLATWPEGKLTGFAEALRELLHGARPLGARIDAFIAAPFENMSEAVAGKLLSLAHPTEFLPIFSFASPMGKQTLMAPPVLGLTPPAEGTTGDKSVEANRVLRERLEPYFGDDLWRMSAFLYWLQDHQPAVGSGGTAGESVEILAKTLYLDEGFLTKALQLLRRKRQLIFYGPPGTGKTFIARALVEFFIEGDDSRAEVVQFHPSYSYEDFVRGYRPVTDDEGNLSYELRDGPLVRLAETARAAAGNGTEVDDATEEYDGVVHVLLIDEINRGNLPRILGELLYLLEYRRDTMSLMYTKPDEPRFSLPRNLWIIGTMNTADRSIGLIDAALRRRFHFLGLFPGKPPLEHTLAGWLIEHTQGTDHIPALVDRLNQKLRQKFGPDLQVGHSYFMQKDIDDELLETIWESDVMSFLADQLIGREDEFEEFTLSAIKKDLAGLPSPAASDGGGQGPSVENTEGQVGDDGAT